VGGESLLELQINKPSLAREGGSGSAPPATRSGKLCEWWREENSTGEGKRPTSHVSCKQTGWLAGAATHTQQSGAGKLVKVVVGGKLHKRGRKTHLPREL
jgi:hypothetical protein